MTLSSSKSFFIMEPFKELRKRGWFDGRETEWEDSFFLKQIRLVLIQKFKTFSKRLQSDWLAGFKRNEPHRELESHPRDRFTVGQENEQIFLRRIMTRKACQKSLFIQKTNFLKSRPQYGR